MVSADYVISLEDEHFRNADWSFHGLTLLPGVEPFLRNYENAG